MVCCKKKYENKLLSYLYFFSLYPVKNFPSGIRSTENVLIYPIQNRADPCQRAGLKTQTN